MAKWRVKKSRSSDDWPYPWTTVSPNGLHMDWSSWAKAMEDVNNELRREQKRKNPYGF